MTRYAVTLTHPSNKVPVFRTVRATPDTVVDIIFALPGMTPETKVEYSPLISRMTLRPSDLLLIDDDLRAARQELYAEAQTQVRQEYADRRSES